MIDLPESVATVPQTPEDKERQNRDLKKLHDFYSIKYDKDWSLKGISLKKAYIIDKLKENNLYRYDLDSGDFNFIRIHNGLVSEISIPQMVDCFVDYVNQLPEYTHVKYIENRKDPVETTISSRQIYDALCERIGDYFSPNLLARLKYDGKIDILKDESKKMHFFFRNGYVEVTPQGYILKDYSTLHSLVWESMVIDRDFCANREAGEYSTFISHVAGWKDKNPQSINPTIQKRILCLRTMIGYLLHNFSDYKLKATIFTDEKIGENKEANGRTGKSLFLKSLNYIKNREKGSGTIVELNGKDFRTDNKHKYQSAGMNTSLLIINDLERNFDIEKMFNDITDGVTVEKKNKNPFYINPKMAFSTNLTIKVNGASAKDRVCFFEFSDYFSDKHSPEDEFGHWMFTDWDETEWNKFDTFMIESAQLFLTYGLKEAPYINLQRREVIEHTSQEFIDFMTDWIETGSVTSSFETVLFYPNTKIDKRKLFNAFTFQYPDYNCGWFKQKTFTSWLHLYCQNNKTYKPISKELQTEGRANGIDWIVFATK